MLLVAVCVKPGECSDHPDRTPSNCSSTGCQEKLLRGLKRPEEEEEEERGERAHRDRGVGEGMLGRGAGHRGNPPGRTGTRTGTRTAAARKLTGREQEPVSKERLTATTLN